MALRKDELEATLKRNPPHVNNVMRRAMGMDINREYETVLAMAPEPDSALARHETKRLDRIAADHAEAIESLAMAVALLAEMAGNRRDARAALDHAETAMALVEDEVDG
jgi:hypothetical protein